MIYLLAAALSLMLWVFLCAPSRKRRRAEPWRGTAFAHRGLHGPDCPENSLPAFERACAAGYGIELDVQMTRDGHPVVFHDDDAARMTGHRGLIREMTLAQMRALRLSGGSARIPTLEETLDAVAGRGPLLVEIKDAPDIRALTERTVELLRKYDGKFAVQSFNPLCLYWLRRLAPEMLRGYLIQGYRAHRKSQSPPVAFFASSLLANVIARPDFIAHHRLMRRNPSLWLCRDVFRTPTAQWTIVARDEMEKVARQRKMPIFEGID